MGKSSFHSHGDIGRYLFYGSNNQKKAIFTHWIFLQVLIEVSFLTDDSFNIHGSRAPDHLRPWIPTGPGVASFVHICDHVELT